MIFFLSKSASSVSQSQAHLAKQKRIGWPIGCNSWTNWTLYGILPRSLCSMMSQWCLRNVQLLRSTENCCWWRFIHTFGHSSNILGCMHCFWLFTLWFIDEDANFFHSFHKISNKRSWRWFSSTKIRMQFSHTFCNITMISHNISHIRSAEG